MNASGGRAIDEMGQSGMNGSTFAFMSFVQLVVMEWYCACGDAGWKGFDKEWNQD